jgi:hypothetical protein
LGITEELLQQTEKEWLTGTLSEETEMLWWGQFFPPSKTAEKFAGQAKEIRSSRRDTLALYELILETWEKGYSCEILICWNNEEDNPPAKIQDIDLSRESIHLDFDGVHREYPFPVLLYRFSTNTSKKETHDE